jgi:malate dehydrogenase (quinone)
MKEKDSYYSDAILIGTGIMSATLGTFLKKLEPQWTMQIFERMDRVAMESSEAWNNAGTGHSAFCELNYTPQNTEGAVSTSKAVKIAESYEVSKEFWSFLVEKGIIDDPLEVIRHIPHISFVWGEEDTAFLRKRFAALRLNALFSDMQYSEDPSVLKTWMPLVMDGRDPNEPVAGTRMDIGTDVNFGTLSRMMLSNLENGDNIDLHLHHEVEDIQRRFDGLWELTVKNLETGDMSYHTTKFVFIGAGGGSLSLLEKADIPEGDGYGGFPISGQWLVCNKPEIIAQHHAKVYGKAKVGSPPMSVPHLDTRMIDGKQALLFGPFAGFSTKFLKHGSYLDLPQSVKWGNIMPLIQAGIRNIPLTKYLVEQVVQAHDDRMDALLEYFPNAKTEDWTLQQAGQRVQVIKKDEKEGGVLEFGTEVVYAKDGSLATLLGASPGASTSVSIMLDVLAKCFPEHVATPKWQKKLAQLIPSYGHTGMKDADFYRKRRERTTKILKLDED